MTPQSVIAHVDMDSFYASVEVLKNPLLKGKPVVVGADPKDGKGRGVVCTSSYEARKYGIHSAMPISEAYSRCQSAIYLLPDYPSYQEISQKIMEILGGYTSHLEQVSIDEAFLDISWLGSLSKADGLCREIKEKIQRNCGLSCSIGVGTSKVIAKIASDSCKPDGLLVVSWDEQKDFLSSLPVRRIPGIGKKTDEQLRMRGILTIGDLSTRNIQDLIGWFGRMGSTMHMLARGIDPPAPVVKDTCRSVSREVTFDEDTADMGIIGDTFSHMAADLDTVLREERMSFKTLTIKFRYQGFSTKTRALSFSTPQESLDAMKENIRRLSGSLADGRKVRLVGMRISSLGSNRVRQARLSDFPGLCTK